MLTLKLPFPVTANKYWRIAGRRMIKTKEARQYAQMVMLAWIEAKTRGMKKFADDAHLAVAVAVMYPRRRGPNADIDNLAKVLIDALEGADIFNNDNQLRHIQLTREASENPEGGVRVSLRECGNEMRLHDGTFTVHGIHE